MLTRIQLRIRLVVLVGGPFVMDVRFMGGRGFVLGVRVVRGGGELCCLIVGHDLDKVEYVCVGSVAFGDHW
jgi:hypothetical protein